MRLASAIFGGLLLAAVPAQAMMGSAQPGVERETTNLIKAMTVSPNWTQVRANNELYRNIKSFGVLAIVDHFYVLAAHDSQAGLLDWVAPGTSTLTAVNSPTFTKDIGYNGNGSTSYLNTGWAPSSLTNFQQNTGQASVWSFTNTLGANNAFFGCADVGDVNSLRLYPSLITTNKMSFAVNGPSDSNYTNADTTGFYSIRAETSTLVRALQNAVEIKNAVLTSTARCTRNLYILARDNSSGVADSFWSGQLGFFMIGGLMESQSGTNAARERNVFISIRTYLRRLGNAV